MKETMKATIDDLVCINNKNKHYKCYKLLGYDILINNDIFILVNSM